jgi:hypothetical protein
VVVAALDIGGTKAAVCRTFDIRRNTLIDSPARIGWSTGLKVEGGRSDAPPATERNPDRRAVRSNYGSARAGAALHIIRGRYRNNPAVPRTTRGGQPSCSDLAIATALTLQTVFRLALRQSEGLISSILQLLDLAVPDHSTLSRRAETLKLPKTRSGLGCGPVHLLVDSTGLRLCGPGEWLIEKHGTKRRRAWRVLHLATDADTGRIVASVLTDKDADDGSQIGPLLERIEGAVASVTGDGAYDRDDVYTEVAARHPEAAVVVPPRANAVPSETAEIAPTQRDRHLRRIAERGRRGWQRASGYGWRALVEADISRWKRVIGDGLRSQTDGRQATEVAVAADVLNRMLALGRPKYVRIA